MIRQIYEDTKDLESLAKIYKDGKKEIYKLENEIETLKEEKNKINTSELSRKIEELENELQIITKELECNKIIENKCFSLKELENILDNIMDEHICLEKCLGFMNNLITIFNISNKQLEDIFNLKKEEETFKIIKISNEIEELFKICKSKLFFRDLEMEFKSRMKSELITANKITKTVEDSGILTSNNTTTTISAVPFDIECFTASNFLYIVFPLENILTFDQLIIKNPKLETFSSLENSFKFTANFILFVLRNNLSHSFINDCYSMTDLIENNKKLKNTEFYIENIEEWALDCVMKEIISIPKNKISMDDLHNINDGLSGILISNSYYKLLNLKNFIENSKSARKNKAILFYEKSIMKFFSLDKIDKDNIFITYSDISHFTKKFDDFRYYDQLISIREELYCKMLNLSTELTLDLSQSTLILKSKIKQLQFDFYENIKNFVSKNTQKFFKIQFFEKLYENFINILLKQQKMPQKLSISDKEKLKEISQYLLDISFELGTDSISNYCKIASLYECLDSSIDDLIDLYEFGSISLDDSELKIIVQILFEDSESKNCFINRLS